MERPHFDSSEEFPYFLTKKIISMDNLKSPAHPHITYGLYGEGPEASYSETDKAAPGFTKLELASLMIAQGLTVRSGFPLSQIVSESVVIAKAILEEANK